MKAHGQQAPVTAVYNLLTPIPEIGGQTGDALAWRGIPDGVYLVRYDRVPVGDRVITSRLIISAEQWAALFEQYGAYLEAQGGAPDPQTLISGMQLPRPSQASAPIVAKSDAGALFELIAQVGGRMPQDGAR